MPSPTAVLLQVLREHRDAGDEFGEAWPNALQLALVDVHDPVELKQWRQALQGTVGAWRVSYERAPVTRLERHLSLLADPVDREAITTTRACAQCAGPLPVDAASHALHCSKRCRDRASYQRRAEAKNERRREQRRLAAA